MMTDLGMTTEWRAALATEQIGDLLALWCEAFNAGDAASMASLFSPGGRMDAPGLSGDAAELACSLVKLSARWKASSANECIEVAADALQAEAESYLFLTGGAAGAPPAQLAGRALDRFIALDGTWTFASRQIIIDWQLDRLEQEA